MRNECSLSNLVSWRREIDGVRNAGNRGRNPWQGYCWDHPGSDWNSKRAIYSCVVWKHTVLYFLVWWPALCESLHHCSSPGFMNEPTLRQRLRDGSDPAVMSLLKWREGKGAVWALPFIHLSLFPTLSAVPTPLILWWAHVTGEWLITPSTQPLSFPALPWPAMPDPAAQTLDPVTEIPISCPRSTTHKEPC